MQVMIDLPEVTLQEVRRYGLYLCPRDKDLLGDAIKNAVPVVHGRWEEQTVISNDVANHIDEWQSVRCSVCKRYLTTPYLYYFTNYDYCPHCGADMRVNE